MILKTIKIRIFYEAEERNRFLLELQKTDLFMFSDAVGGLSLTAGQKILQDAVNYLVPKPLERQLVVSREDFLQNNDFLIKIAEELLQIKTKLEELVQKNEEQRTRLGFDDITPAEKESVETSIKQNDSQIEEYSAQVRHIADNYTVKIQVYHDYLLNLQLRESLEIRKTRSFEYVEGYVIESNYETLKETLSKVISTISFEKIPTPKEYLLPTAIKQNKFSANFEGITNGFSVPSSKGVDPNFFVSIWYVIIFGMMMADIGYGILILVLTILYKKFKKPVGNAEKLVNVIHYSAYSVIFFGIIFEMSFFGAGLLDIFGIKASDVPFPFLSPVNDVLILLGISLALGVLHIICGLAIHLVLCFRRKEFAEGLSKDLSWICLLLGIGLIACNMLNIVPFDLSIPAFALLGIGGLCILVFSGHGQGVVGHIVKPLASLYGATGFLSDLLSYTRILALCLAGAQIGSTMNMLGIMVLGIPIPGLNILCMVVVIALGQTINFASGILSAYIHTSRLQFLEFFSKFYEGDGLLFEPLTFQFKYIRQFEYNRSNL
jgi:V/A-type H+-transporting ATPase subunit I